jgi:hypothetical protein
MHTWSPSEFEGGKPKSSEPTRACCQELPLKSSISRDWSRILGRRVARAFVYAAAATARREGHVEILNQSSQRPKLSADEISSNPGLLLRKSRGRIQAAISECRAYFDALMETDATQIGEKDAVAADRGPARLPLDQP